MRYFFDVAHSADIVVFHVSEKVAVLLSRGNLHQPLTKSVGATHVLILKNPLALAASAAKAGKMVGPLTGAGTRQAGLFDTARKVPVTGSTNRSLENVFTGHEIEPPDQSFNPTKLKPDNAGPDATRDMAEGSHVPDTTTNHVKVEQSSENPYATLEENTGTSFQDSSTVNAGIENRPVTAQEFEAEKEKSVLYGKEKEKAIKRGEKRDRWQTYGGGALMAGMHLQGRAQQKQAELEAEEQRLMQQRGTQDANTGGGQVAVTTPPPLG